ncbi:MAG TPA: hypothetical protein EYQ00_09400 [Dehalococcoidia bacterium]|nr:hypothetical protein [Dehalococcoidia bacterium]
MSKIIRCPSPDLKEIRRLADDGQKIAAIKRLRTKGKSFPPTRDVQSGELTHRVGLRDAKTAVEAIMGQNKDPDVRAIPMLRIKAFKIETEEGVVEVDLDGLQLKLLEGLDHLPLDSIGEMVELVAFIRTWQGETEDS